MLKFMSSPNRTAGQLQVGDQLRLVNGSEFIDGLDLDKHCPFNDQIRDERVAESLALVDQRHGSFPLKLQPGPMQFELEAGLIHRFEQTGAKDAVHLDTAPDDPLGQAMVKKWFVEHACAEGKQRSNEKISCLGNHGDKDRRSCTRFFARACQILLPRPVHEPAPPRGLHG